MAKVQWLQLLAGGTPGGQGAASGEGTAAAGQGAGLQGGTPSTGTGHRPVAAAAVQAPGGAETGQRRPEQGEKPSWEQLMADPQYNRAMQATVKERLDKARRSASREALEPLRPLLERLAGECGMETADLSRLDLKALTRAALEHGEEARQKELARQQEQQRQLERRQARARQAQRQQLLRKHYDGLRQQGEAMREVFPNFDLKEALREPAFLRLTSPGVGLSVEDAYYALHRREIQQASMRYAVEKTAQRLRSSWASGLQRPVENGAGGQAASTSAFDYSKASRGQREAIKRSIRSAAARGEKIYPAP